MRQISWLWAVVVTVSLLGVPSAQAYEPPSGAVFNVPRPWGSDTAKFRIIRTVEAAMRAVPGPSAEHPNPSIHVSTFLMDRRESVNALIDACRRGVSVRVILDQDIDNSNSVRLIRALNGDNVEDTDGDTVPDTEPSTGRCGSALPPPPPEEPPADGDAGMTTTEALASVEMPAEKATWGGDKSYVKRCSGSCRGGGGNVHSKFYLFSRTGTAQNVVMVSSANLNDGGATLGWNDLMVMKNRPKSFEFYSRIHGLMTEERRAGRELVQVADGPYISRFFPMVGATKADDPTLRDLNAIRCKGSPLGATRIHVSMFYWQGTRGDYLLDALLAKARAGCRVAIIYGAPSVAIAERLRKAARAGLVRLYDSRWDFNDDGWNEVRTHAKYVLVKGWYRQNSRAQEVWTGSQNWVAGSLTMSDESTLNVSSGSVYRQYLANWENIRKHSRRLPLRR